MASSRDRWAHSDALFPPMPLMLLSSDAEGLCVTGFRAGYGQSEGCSQHVGKDATHRAQLSWSYQARRMQDGDHAWIHPHGKTNECLGMLSLRISLCNFLDFMRIVIVEIMHLSKGCGTFLWPGSFLWPGAESARCSSLCSAFLNLRHGFVLLPVSFMWPCAESA